VLTTIQPTNQVMWPKKKKGLEAMAEIRSLKRATVDRW
jgi:hypothetical protein